MEWIEITITTKSEAVDYVSAALAEAGVTGFQIEDDTEIRQFLEENKESWDYVDAVLLEAPRPEAYIKFYLNRGEAGEKLLEDIKRAVFALKESADADFGSLQFSAKGVDDADWIDNWKKYYKPFKIGKNVTVRPCWEECEAGSSLVLTINPGHLFGTGLHQTTRMCMESLERFVKKGDKTADIGCGSGILPALALLLGAEWVYACDIEPEAARVVYENIELNDIDKSRCMAETGNLLEDEGRRRRLCRGGFDLVTANIVADVIIPLCPYAFGMLREGGLFITSGIIRGRAGDVSAALESSGFFICETLECDEWFCIIAEKIPSKQG